MQLRNSVIGQHENGAEESRSFPLILGTENAVTVERFTRQTHTDFMERDPSIVLTCGDSIHLLGARNHFPV
jgi:hypothetical protein